MCVHAVASSLFPIMLHNLQASSYEDSTGSINDPQFINSHSKAAKQSTMQACQWKKNAILWYLFLFKLLELSSLTRLQVLGSLCYSGPSQCNDKPSFTSQDSIVWNLLAFIYLSFDLNSSWIVNVQKKMNTQCLMLLPRSHKRLLSTAKLIKVVLPQASATDLWRARINNLQVYLYYSFTLLGVWILCT